MFSFHKKPSTSQWLLCSVGVLVVHFIVGLAIVIAVNGKMVNHALTPIFQYFGIFKLTWPEQPLGSLHFLATKSILVLSHFDPRSALNLWTLEYDFYTLVIYIAISLILGRLAGFYLLDKTLMPAKVLAAFAASAFFISFSISYMTVLEHCSGATWVGFVALYGLGLNEFELYPIYQIICAIIGISGFAAAVFWLNHGKNRAFS